MLCRLKRVRDEVVLIKVWPAALHTEIYGLTGHVNPYLRSYLGPVWESTPPLHLIGWTTTSCIAPPFPEKWMEKNSWRNPSKFYDATSISFQPFNMYQHGSVLPCLAIWSDGCRNVQANSYAGEQRLLLVNPRHFSTSLLCTGAGVWWSRSYSEYLCQPWADFFPGAKHCWYGLLQNSTDFAREWTL